MENYAIPVRGVKTADNHKFRPMGTSLLDEILPKTTGDQRAFQIQVSLDNASVLKLVGGLTLATLIASAITKSL